jgi:shikimate kinase
MNIILIGFKSCGKSATGRALAAKLKKKLIDTDRLMLESHCSLTGELLTMGELFDRYGELYFRTLEKEVIATLSEQHAVIATGGGTVMEPANITHLKKFPSCFIYLDLSLELLHRRIEQQPPSGLVKSLSLLSKLAPIHTSRDLLYRKIADLHLKITNETADQIAEMITSLSLDSIGAISSC